MNRALLCGAIEGLVSQYGYHFHLNDEAYYPTVISRYPAAFMSQPAFESIEGRQGAKLAPTERNELLGRMEQELIEIFVALSKAECVAVVNELTISPSAQPIDNHGAVSLAAKANVTTIF